MCRFEMNKMLQSETFASLGRFTPRGQEMRSMTRPSQNRQNSLKTGIQHGRFSLAEGLYHHDMKWFENFLKINEKKACFKNPTR